MPVKVIPRTIVVGQVYKDMDTRRYTERYLTVTGIEGEHAVCSVNGKTTTRVQVRRLGLGSHKRGFQLAYPHDDAKASL